jgi:hypothetical protein
MLSNRGMKNSSPGDAPEFQHMSWDVTRDAKSGASKTESNVDF